MKQDSLYLVSLTEKELFWVNGGSEQSYSAGESVGSFAARIANAIESFVNYIVEGVRDAMEYMGEMYQDAGVSSGTITT